FNFEEVEISPKLENEVITFIYAGGFYENIRDPRPFLDYISTLDVDFRFVVYTKGKSLLKGYEDKLKGKLIVKDYIPRLDIIKVMSQADFLVNFENGTAVQSPSKLIDYALSQRPILSIDSLNPDKSKVDEFFNKNYNRQYVI